MLKYRFSHAHAHGNLRAVEEFQRLNFRIIAIGHSFNDIPMLKVRSIKCSAGHPRIHSLHIGPGSLGIPRKTYFYIFFRIFGVNLIKYLGFWSK